MSSVIGALRVNLGIDSAEFQEGLKQAQSGLKKFGAVVKTGMLAAAAAAGAALGSLAVSVKGTIDAADNMSKAAAKIGMSIEELSRLKYAADLSGVSFEGLQTAIGKLSKTMNDAKNGSKSAIDSFAQIGVSATNADGSLKSASQVLAEISDKFAAMPDGAEKTALAMELMGRSGAAMIPLLNGGAGALESLMAEADTFGQVFTAEMGANAEVFNDNMSRLQGVFGNISAQVATALLPHLAAFSNWLVENAPQITAFAVAIVDGGVALVQFGADIVNLGVQITAFLTTSWAQFEAAWDGLVGTVHNAKDQAIAAVAQLIADLIASLQSIPAAMAEIGGQIVDGLWQGIQAKWESVKAGVSGLAGSLVDSVKSTLGIHSPSKVMHAIGEFVVQGLQNGMASLSGSAVAQAGELAGRISGQFSDIGSSFKSMFSGFGSSIAEAIKGTKKWSDVISDLLSKLADNLLQSSIQMLFGAIFGGGGSPLGGLIPGFASGGTILPGGAGGIDSQLVAFRKSPNERVDITKPGQSLRSGGDVKIEIINNTPAQVRQERERGGDGTEIRRFIIETVKQGMATGDFDQPNKVRFGTSPTKVVR